LCAAIACVNAVCWSILTPPFQVADEPSHFAYTQQLAENTALPTAAEASPSPEELTVMHDLHQYEVRQSPETHTISTATQQQILQEDLDRGLSRHGGGGIGGAHSDPPLFYLLETVPYGLASAGTLLDQLEAMRLLSALMAGLTALFAFMFVREALPEARWAWTVGGLSVALAPALGFISGGVNPDSMLIAVSAATFYCLARGFRRGFTRGLAVATGAVLAVGFLTKLNFIGLVPGIVLGMVLLAVRASRTHGRRAYGSLALGLAVGFTPVLLYTAVNLLSGHAGLGVVSTFLNQGSHGSIFTKVGYVWQLYLPRLPGMTNYFPGLSTTRDLWFDRGVGLYGWLDTSFPEWVDRLALVPTVVLAALCVRSLALGRAAVRRRAAEIAVYAAMAFGLFALIGLTSFVDLSEGLFADPRYLLPLLPLLGLLLALAARGAGRRWGPPAGVLIVLLFLAHNVFSQLLVAQRYYA
jgi:4-amino-4-deoxy-L-arabinose transferase-like glycosyltransferase